MKPLEFCCEEFKSSINTSWPEGFSVIPIYCNKQYRFFLQSKVHSPGKEHFSELAIFFCPWCGSNLNKFIEDNIDAIANLTEECKHLMLDNLHEYWAKNKK